MLGDAAGFAGDHIGPAQRVEQAGLAMIDMAHDRDDRGARLQMLGIVDIFVVTDVDIAFADAFHLMAEFGDEQFGGVLIDRVGAVTIMPILNSALTRSPVFSAMRLARSWTVIAFGHHDIADLLFARRRLAGRVRALFLFAGALQRGEAARARAFVIVERARNGQLARLAATRRRHG